MKKGFTLIELLAVVVILAIIALVATPIVLNVIEDAKKSSIESSVLLYADGVKLSYSEQMLNPSDKTLKELTDEKMSGEKVNCEVVDYSKAHGVILKNCTVGDYDVRYSYYNGLIEEPTPELLVLTGEAVCARKMEATDGVLATIDNPYIAGGEYVCNVGDGELRTFFVLEEGTNEVSLIMNSNIGNSVAWLSDEDYALNNEDGTLTHKEVGPITAINYLNSETSGWTNVTVSLPTNEQIEAVAESCSVETFNALSGDDLEYTGLEENVCQLPSWLNGNLIRANSSDESYPEPVPQNGNNIFAYYVVEDVNISGFTMLYVDCRNLSHSLIMGWGGVGHFVLTPSTDTISGVRPVITVSKTLMK